MRSSLECLPCLLRQALDASRYAIRDEQARERAMRRLVRELSRMDFRQPPPVTAQTIHRLLRRMSGVDDPYREAKERFNSMAMDLLPSFEKTIAGFSNPLEGAVRLAIAGNVIDLGAKGDLTEQEAFAAVERALDGPVVGDIETFESAVREAGDILYLTDNAGEIVFDRVLMQALQSTSLTVAVRGASVINDATMSDAVAAGIPDIARVIDNGSDAPGTILQDCSAEFKRAYEKADLVIAKGQGNYETICDEEANIFFLFKVKCPVVAEHSGMEMGAHALIRSRRRQQT